jgi:cytochrome c-type biogenesis protein CcmH/NrfG
MSLKIFGCILIVSALAPYALLVYQLRSRVSLTAPQSGPAGVRLTARLRESGSLLRHVKRDGGRGTLTIAAAVFLVVAGAGFAKSYLGQAPDVSDETMAASRSSDAGDPADLADGDLEQLADYARSVATASPAATDGKTQPDTATLLPDVNTMIERLAARLASAPDDVQGWRTLGWSYLNTGRYDDAVKAYAKAVALDPNSPEIARLYEDAKSKASGGAGVASATDATTPVESRAAARLR